MTSFYFRLEKQPADMIRCEPEKKIKKHTNLQVALFRGTALLSDCRCLIHAHENVVQSRELTGEDVVTKQIDDYESRARGSWTVLP